MNEIHLREMVPLAMYETKEDKKALRICKYYKSDYIAVQLLKTFFLTTIAYLLVLGLVAAGNIDWLLDNIDSFDPMKLGSILLILYIVVLAIYMIITFVISKRRYEAAKKSVRAYEIQLRRLEKMMKRSDGETDKQTGRRSRR
ncbi:MAG: hypothetical protein VZR02_05090 [Lachnospiraceae bacterium]|nr:hypothetical protein [Lachnospiraceae bacterium]